MEIKDIYGDITVEIENDGASPISQMEVSINKEPSVILNGQGW